MGDGWLHELKHDGFRVLAFKDDERVRRATGATGRPSSSQSRRRCGRSPCPCSASCSTARRKRHQGVTSCGAPPTARSAPTRETARPPLPCPSESCPSALAHMPSAPMLASTRPRSPTGPSAVKPRSPAWLISPFRMNSSISRSTRDSLANLKRHRPESVIRRASLYRRADLKRSEQRKSDQSQNR